ncbi:unnamed protein product [Ectocarpus sp. 13 AM-2016]
MFRRRGGAGYRRLRVAAIDSTHHDVGGAGETYRENPSADRSKYASEISSSLSLQILIYYNGLLSLIYFVLGGGLVIEKLYSYKFESELQRTVLAPIFISWAIAEVHRFYFGYKGNIKEMVPHMCAFLLMTVFPQMFCLAFLAFFQEHQFPVDPIFGAIHIAFLASETIIGYNGIKAIINKRTAQFFRVAQEEYLLRPMSEEHARLL